MPPRRIRPDHVNGACPVYKETAMPRSSRLLFLILVIALAADAHQAAAQPPFVVETIDPGGFVGTYISLAVDDYGRPHVVYWDGGNGWLNYATRVDGTWVTEIIEATAFVGLQTSIAIDAQGVPHVSYHNFTAITSELRYAHRTGDSWTTEDVDLSDDVVGRYNAIALDAQGRPHIVYQDETAADKLMYAVKDGGWTIETVETNGTGYYNDLVLDASGQPHISYLDDEPDLFYRRKITGTWYKETMPGGVSNQPTAIDLNPAGEATIAYSTASTTATVSRDGFIWVVTALTNAGSFDGAFEFDSQGRVELVYRSLGSALFDLWRYGFVDTGLVNSPIVETSDAIDIGSYADLAHDPHGNTVVAYYDATNGDAMLADSGVWLTTALTGVTWPVGAERSISWRGAGTVDILLSANGGASYEAIATGLIGTEIGGMHSFTVPHAPSRFCKIRVQRADPFAQSDNDSLFTIETSVSLLNFVVTIPPTGGVDLAWQTDPGPADLAGYRVERGWSDAWSTLTALTTKTNYHDADGRAGHDYRLYAINKLGGEMLLTTGKAGSPPSLSALDVFPNPFGTGDLNVSFATGSGLGGGAGDVTVTVYDVAGRRVATLVQESLPAGFHETTWNGRDANGRLVPSGVYFVRAETGGAITTRKLTVVR